MSVENLVKTDLHVQVVGMLEIALNCWTVILTTAFEKLLTLSGPPDQDQVVSHVILLPLAAVTSEHCDPVPADSPQRSA